MLQLLTGHFAWILLCAKPPASQRPRHAAFPTLTYLQPTAICRQLSAAHEPMLQRWGPGCFDPLLVLSLVMDSAEHSSSEAYHPIGLPAHRQSSCHHPQQVPSQNSALSELLFDSLEMLLCLASPACGPAYAST